MTANDDLWVREIAASTETDVDSVRRTLDRYGIPGERPVAPRKRLRLEGVHFAGVKNVAVSEGSAEREDRDFSFTHRYEHLVTAFATKARNDAGKTSVVNVTEWALRGTSKGLQPDVRNWIRQAVVGFTVAGERILVLWKVNDGVPTGVVLTVPEQVHFEWTTADAVALNAGVASGDAVDRWVTELCTAGSEILADFDSEPEFKKAMAAVMTPRIGFDSLSVWQNNPNALDDEDGKLISQDWPLWSQALVISDPEIVLPLGEIVTSASAVLQMYLGTKWGTAAATASGQKKAISASLSGLRRRNAADTKAKDSSVGELTTQLQSLEQQLADLPADDTVDAVETRIAEARAAAAQLEAAEAELLRTARNWGTYEKDLEMAEADLAALLEAERTRRFWHSLTPTCCPRCDAQVDAERLRRETEGQCSLCDSELSTTTVDVDIDTAGGEAPADDLEPDDLEAARDRVATLGMEAQESSAAHDVALNARDALRAVYEAAAARVVEHGGSALERRSLELELATLRGRLAERRTETPESPKLAQLERDLAIVESAHKLANKWKLDDQGDLLVEVSRQIAEIGLRLGVAQLQEATFKSDAKLQLVKGGSPATFTTVNKGEQLRLKIAVVVALLRVGGRSGVNRHPGVLFIDSFAREEMSAANAISTLEALQSVADEFDVQIVTSSANGNLLSQVLPDGSVRMATADDDYMW